MIARSDTRGPIDVTFAELREQVAAARAGLRELGVGPGDRVVGYLPNIPETLVAFLASASLGAIWATCPPEFGPRSVIDRFGTLEPKVLLAVAGYRYGERELDRRGVVAEIRAALPTLEHVVHVPYPGGADDALPDTLELGAAARQPRTARVHRGPVRPSAVGALLLRDDRAAEGDRAPPRRDGDRAPQEPRPLAGICSPADG